jgi:transcriptional regulator NrdR family protein
MANCPSCKSSHTKVSEAHLTFNNEAKRIRRTCLTCNHRWTVYEVSPETIDKYKVLKEKFDRLRKMMFADDTVFSCHNCMQWTNDCCSLDIPEAGGSFASECPYYYKA